MEPSEQTADVPESSETDRFSGYGTALMIFGWVFALIVLPAVIVAVTLPKPWVFVTPIGVALLVAYPLVRALRIRLEVGPDEIVIVNYFRTYRIHWPDVESIAVGAGSALASWGDGINVRLRRGKREILCQASVSSESHRSAMLDALRTHAEPWGIPVTSSGL